MDVAILAIDPTCFVRRNMNTTGRQKTPSHDWRYMFGFRCSCTSRRCLLSPKRFALPTMPLYLDTTQELPKQLSHSDCRLAAIRTWVVGRTLTKPNEAAKRKAPFLLLHRPGKLWREPEHDRPARESIWVIPGLLHSICSSQF